MTVFDVPSSIADPTNAAILAVSEDRVPGFQRFPFEYIAAEAGLPTETVVARIRAMLESGAIRRVRQTLLATSLAPGALAAWKLPAERLDEAFAFMSECDPFSGHVVIRSTDAEIPGAAYRLWTTLKVPQGYSLEAHARYLAAKTGVTSFRLMPARYLFVLGVGHTRRKSVAPGDRSPEPAVATPTGTVELTPLEWRVLTALKRELAPAEVGSGIWEWRAAEVGMDAATFCAVADDLAGKGIIGRFSTFLEHVKPHADGARVTRYNALFHWAVPQGRELEAGTEVGRHYILTHAYWREAGPEFGGVNIMAVAHGLSKELLLDHKAAMDAHLLSCGIPVSYTNVFWGGRSEIKPSEVSPVAYEAWCRSEGIDLESMRDQRGEKHAIS